MDCPNKFDTLDTVIPHVKLFVEATNNEHYFLYEKYKDDNVWESAKFFFRKEVGESKTSITFNFAHINGNLVCFYYFDGTIINWNDVDDYIKSLGIKKTNTSNFVSNIPN